MDLHKELGAVAQMVREKTPPHVMPTIEATTKRLKESGLEDHALQTGQTMPDFELPDATGEIVRSVELRSQGPLLITFYRGSWCPFCNLALRALQELNKEIKNCGGTLLAISPQTPDHSLTLQEKHSLQFPVLSDAGTKWRGSLESSLLSTPASRQCRSSLAWTFLLTTGITCLNCRSRQLFWYRPMERFSNLMSKPTICNGLIRKRRLPGLANSDGMLRTRHLRWVLNSLKRRRQ